MLGRKIAKISDDLWAIYCDSDITEASDCRLNIFSLSAKSIVKKHFPVTKNEYEWRYYEEINNFQITDSAVYFVYALNDTIYHIDSNGEQTAYGVIDFGSHNLPADLLTERYSDVLDFAQKIEKFDYVHIVSPIYVTSSGVFCGFRYKNKYYHAYGNQGGVTTVNNYNTFLSLEGYNMTPSAMPAPLYYGKDKSYSILEAHQVPDEYKKEISTKYNVPEMSSENNPYILKYKIF